MQRVLIVGYVWPEPASTAAGAHMMSLLEMFAQAGWVITFASAAARTERTADLAQLGITCEDIALNHSSFDAFVAQLQPSVVIFDRFMTEEQFGWRVEKSCPEALRLLDTEDLFCLRQARRDAFRKHGTLNPPLDASLLFTELAQREIASILRCDLSLIISEAEIALLTDLFRVDPALLQYYPLCYHADRAENRKREFGGRSGFIVIGNYRHAPNWDAVLWLKESIWPAIRKLLPAAQCRIYGAYTPPKATALHNPGQGFHIMGWAEDAQAVLGKARVSLAPLRFGAGLKGKIAQAMACGTPSVTTSVGAEGVAGELPFAGAVADDAAQFATHAVLLHEQGEAWEQAVRNGDSILRKRFCGQQHDRNLLQRIACLQGDLARHRLHNFTGGMLRHHQHRSTQYMSQWIEAKNRD